VRPLLAELGPIHDGRNATRYSLSMTAKRSLRMREAEVQRQGARPLDRDNGMSA